MIHVNNVRATGIELTPATRDYIDKKIEALRKFVEEDDTSASIDVEIGKTTEHHKLGNVFRAEFNFMHGGKMFRAAAEEEDLHAAIDIVKDELAEQLRSDKERKRTLWRRGASIVKELTRGFRWKK